MGNRLEQLDQEFEEGTKHFGPTIRCPQCGEQVVLHFEKGFFECPIETCRFQIKQYARLI
ncbi:MAG: hypothetical protein ACRCTE_01270 [Cellulosilyticaceae bacterium]